jgi:hypothetical protein
VLLRRFALPALSGSRPRFHWHITEVIVYARACLLPLLFVLLSGCTSGASAPPISSDHPASPDAGEAAPNAQSQTLTTAEAPTIRESNPSMPQMQMRDGQGTSGMSHGSGEMNHGAMPHGMSNMSMPSTQPGAAAALSAPREAAATQPATTQTVLYTCVMHPEVMSDKPGKCPKCGMTLVEKKREAR